MKRSGFKQKNRLTAFHTKARKPLKSARFGLRRTKLHVVGHSSVSQIKAEIQAILREIVILRDGECILYGIKCNHKIGSEGIVFQCEHLIERSNSATYGDTRLVVLVCKNCHGWKHFTKSNHDQYDEWVKTKLSKERVDHWDRCKKDSWRPSKMDWNLVLVGLKQELSDLRKKRGIV